MATKKETAIAKLDELYETSGVLALAQLPTMQRAVASAQALKLFQTHVDVILEDILPLAGKGIGFQIDKQYSKEAIRDGITEALMLGLEPTGRQFAIISGRMYIQKEGLRHIFRRFPGLSDVDVQVNQDIELKQFKRNDKPWVSGHFPVEITYLLNGKAQTFDTTCYAFAFANDTAMDAMRGKAERKGMMKLFEHLTGSAISLVDTDDVEADEAVIVDAEVIVGGDKTEDTEKAEGLAEGLAKELESITEEGDLFDISERIAAAKKADELKPSDIKKLKGAYKAALDRVRDTNGEA